MRIASFAKRVVKAANWVFLFALVFLYVDSWSCHHGVQVSARKRYNNLYQSRWYQVDACRGGVYFEHFYVDAHETLRAEHPWRVFCSAWRSNSFNIFSVNSGSRWGWLWGWRYENKASVGLYSTGGIRSVEAPLWVMILVAAIWPTRMAMTWRRQNRRRRLRLCLGCGYDLRGATGNRCSECGREIPGNSATLNQGEPDFTAPASAQA